ncbi:class I SAM-dependent methyltransferase [Streptomyces sp. NPDC016309]|uniref:class I SAM-dependent methyltransferase n=1 Tax=Streptomyces sp. NPDC016309 TaxID=3364965 RepID=UPI0036F9F953
MTEPRTEAADGTDAAEYGNGIGRFHDLLYPFHDLPSAVARVASVTEPPARVVDFGAGSGRLALALAERGYRVDAVDNSPAMLDQLRARDEKGLVGRHVADIATADVGTGFDLCLITNSTLFMLPSQDAQRAALGRAAAHLGDGGHLLVEVYEPSFFHRLEGAHTQSSVLADGTLLVDSMTNDPVEQLLVLLRTFVSDGRVRTFPEVSRYTWPAELDLMAATEGFAKVARWSDWEGSPFTRGAARHVSLYRKTG